jgi:tetraacyldisaccharide 4'-kinase
MAVARGAKIIVMDDGHQNFTLVKNLSLVVVDAQAGFGNGLMIPAGPLRESVAQGLGRADAVVMMGGGLPNLKNYSGPILRAHLTPQDSELAGKPVFAFAGIGRPEKFIVSLRESGAIVTGTRFFPDHHPYRAAEIAALHEAAKDALLVTTEKDLIRLAPPLRAGIASLPVAARFEDATLLDRLLATV